MQTTLTNKLEQCLLQDHKLLNIYFTAGYPALESTVEILQLLETAGVDMVEIGMPFSDPLADGPVIQHSSEKALQNGMSVERLFEQLESAKSKLPLILMGYLNPVLQYGVERFCKRAVEVGVNAIILPDLPLEIYLDRYQATFRAYGLANIFLLSPQTSEARIRKIDEHSDSFIYAVSSSSTTGNGQGSFQETYLRRLDNMQLQSPLMVGFNIRDRASFEAATTYSKGGIIGSAFIRAITENPRLADSVPAFIQSIR